MITRNASRPRICMLILNEIIRDGRVLRAAEAAAQDHDVLVIGVDKSNFEFDKSPPLIHDRIRFHWVSLGWTGRIRKGSLGYALRFLTCSRRMYSAAVRFKPDLVHAHEVFTLPIAQLIRLRTGATVIYDAHELYREMSSASSNWWTPLLSRFESFSLPRCDAVIACNRWRSQIMATEYAQIDPPTVIQNLPNPSPFSQSSYYRDRFKEMNSEIRVICLHQGHMQPGHGMETLIAAVARLPKFVGLVFVGGGGQVYIKKLENETCMHDVADRVLFEPPVAHSLLHERVSSADIGIVIYQNVCRNNYYCASNKLYDYMHAGLAVVGADLPPIKEVLDTARVGAVFDPESELSLADAIESVRADLERYKTNAHTASEQHSWTHERVKLIASNLL